MLKSPLNSVEDPVGLHHKTGDWVMFYRGDASTGAAAERGLVMRGGG